MATQESATRAGQESRRATAGGPHPVKIGRLLDLEAHTDDIISQVNADKQLALLAVADPVGVLHDLGYELSPRAAREIRRVMPRLTGENRGRYLAWLRDLDPIPDTVDIKLVPRPRGRELLDPPPSREPAGSAGVAGTKGAAAFDVVIQSSEAFAERMLQRHYADARLPRSVYRIGGKLFHFVHSGHYDDVRHSLGTADREIHFGKPSLTFSTTNTKQARVTSTFQATGFGPESIQGSASVDGTLALRKDVHGYPHFVEVTFDGVKAENVTTTLSNSAGTSSPSATLHADLVKMVLNAYKGFRTAPALTKTTLPLTFPLVDGDELSGYAATRKVNATFGVVMPAGASTPLLVVGLNRAERKSGGTIMSVPSFIKPGGDLAMVQDSDWLEKGLDAGFVDALPIRFDASSGVQDKNGDLRIDSIDWHYRAGGLTGNLSGMQDDAFLWWDHSISGQVHIDITFHSSVPTVMVVASSDLVGMACWERFLFTILLIVLAAAVGAAVGAAIGAVAGGAASVGAIIGGIAGGGVGLATALGLMRWPFTGKMSGTPVVGSSKQTLKVTHQQALPDMSATALVIPNGFEIDESGTRLSARVVGPTYEVVEPWVRISGSHTVDIEPLPNVPQPTATTAAAGTANGGDVAVQEPSASMSAGGLLGSVGGVSIEPASAGTISLHYRRASAYGLQGALTDAWTFNGQPIGTHRNVNVDVPVPTATVRMLEHNKVNLLGTLKLTVTDAFGRSASDAVTITVGNAKDLRAYRPRTPPDRFGGLEPDPYSDALDAMRTKWRDDVLSLVGWRGEDDDLPTSDGLLVAYTEFASPLSGRPVAIVGTAPPGIGIDHIAQSSGPTHDQVAREV